MNTGGRRSLVGAVMTVAAMLACVPAGIAPVLAANTPAELCRLPVTTGTDYGFLSYPAGTFTAEATPKPSLPGAQGGVTNFGYSYDTALSRWLPVTSNLVSPDGDRYVYGDLQVVDVKTGTETVLPATNPHFWHPVAWEPQGIYAVTATAAGPDPGLWLISYPEGTARQLSTEGYWQAVKNGGAYGLAAAIPPLDTSVGMLRLDVATGAITQWFYLAGSRPPYVAGFDASGAPVIQQSVEVYLVPSALKPILMTASTHASSAIGDRLGIWVGNSAGIFLFAGGSFTQITDMPASPAGACLAADSTGTTPAGSPSPNKYTVRPGDTLSRIARALGLGSYWPLYWRNEFRAQAVGGLLTNPNLIRPGWILEIPTEPLRVYVVRRGDSLSSVAERFYGKGHGAWWHGIYDANRPALTNPNLIYPGQRLRIP